MELSAEEKRISDDIAYALLFLILFNSKREDTEQYPLIQQILSTFHRNPDRNALIFQYFREAHVKNVLNCELEYPGEGFPTPVPWIQFFQRYGIDPVYLRPAERLDLPWVDQAEGFKLDLKKIGEPKCTSCFKDINESFLKFLEAGEGDYEQFQNLIREEFDKKRCEEIPLIEDKLVKYSQLYRIIRARGRERRLSRAGHSLEALGNGEMRSLRIGLLEIPVSILQRMQLCLARTRLHVLELGFPEPINPTGDDAFNSVRTKPCPPWTIREAPLFAGFFFCQAASAHLYTSDTFNGIFSGSGVQIRVSPDDAVVGLFQNCATGEMIPGPLNFIMHAKFEFQVMAHGFIQGGIPHATILVRKPDYSWGEILPNIRESLKAVWDRKISKGYFYLKDSNSWPCPVSPESLTHADWEKLYPCFVPDYEPSSKALFESKIKNILAPWFDVAVMDLANRRVIDQCGEVVTE
jgi:hypothetical protein